MTDHPLRVLVVEDNPGERWLFSEVLRARGHVVTACEDAESAWRFFRERSYSLLILDWVLPEMDGLELCRRIREHPRGDACVIVMITGRDSPEALERVLEAGADDYIAKPVEVGLLNIRLAMAERWVQDVKRRHQAVAALEDTSNELEALFRNLGEVVFSVDFPSRRLIQMSRAAEEMFGLTVDELREQDDLWPRLLFPEGWKAVQERLEEVEEGETVEGHHQVTRPDGQARWVQSRLWAQLGPDGEILRVDGLLMDVTAAIEARRQLAARNAELEILYGVAEVLLSAPSLSDAASHILPRLSEATGMTLGNVGLYEPATDEIRVLAMAGGPPGADLPERYPAGEAIAGEVIRTGAPVVAEDARSLVEARHAMFRDLDIRSVLVFPITVGDKVAGVVALASPRPGRPSDGACRLVQGVAVQLSGYLSRRVPGTE